MKFLAIAMGLFIVGCASNTVPPADLTDAQMAISAADAVGAEQHPKGALHLKLARDHLNEARSFIEDEEREEALLALKKAEADAQLALMYARTAEARSAAEAAQREVEELSQPY